MVLFVHEEVFFNFRIEQYLFVIHSVKKKKKAIKFSHSKKKKCRLSPGLSLHWVHNGTVGVDHTLSAYNKGKSWCYIHFLPAENLSSFILIEKLLLHYIVNGPVLLHEKYAVLYF